MPHASNSAPAHRAHVALTSRVSSRVRRTPHRFEHLVEGTSWRRGIGSEQKALVNQPGHRAEHLVAPGARRLTIRKDRRGGLDRKEAWQYAEPAERALFVRIEQLVTPGDGPVHGLLTFGEIASTDTREPGVALETMQQILRRQRFQPGSCQLESQRQRIESPADRGHGGRIR